MNICRWPSTEARRDADKLRSRNFEDVRSLYIFEFCKQGKRLSFSSTWRVNLGERT